jgi:hypothetical protein
MRRNILWLDDYFNEFGELTFHSPDLELRADFDEISKRFPSTKIHAETALSGFVQKIIDHERITRGLDSKNPGACKLDAIIIDVMIDNAVQTPIPKLDQTGKRIAFLENGQPVAWEKLHFNQNGNDAGLKLAQYFIQKLDSMRETAIIFYTHRPINAELAQIIGRIKNARTAVGHQKMKGIEPLYKVLAEHGLS